MNKIAKIFNPSNAFIRIEISKLNLVLDPWITDGIYDGGWMIFPRVKNLIKYLHDADIIFFTHLHKDHFDLNILNFLEKKVKFVIPKVFGWQVMKNEIIQKCGKNYDIEVLDFGKTLRLNEYLSVESIPPLNLSGLEQNDDDDDSTFIDSGFIFNSKFGKFAFLADNNLYNYKKIINLNNLRDVDLVGVAYTGFASDYPFNYNYNFKKKVTICNDNEDIRFKIQTKCLKNINAKNLLLYSSEFAPTGENALEYAKVVSEVWTSDKMNVAQKYEKQLGINVFGLYEGDHLTINSKKSISKFESKNKVDLDLINYVKTYSSKMMPNESDIFKIENIDDTLIENCSTNMFKAIDRFQLKPRFNVIIKINESDENIFIDSRTRKVLKNVKKYDENFLIKCQINKKYLYALLSRQTHWNDATLSYRLRWERIPNEFCNDTYNMLNWFTLPREK